MNSSGQRLANDPIFLGPLEGQNPVFRLDINSKEITQLLADKTIDASALSGRKALVYINRSIGELNEVRSVDIVTAKQRSRAKLSRFMMR